jgi:hypothetical protein
MRYKVLVCLLVLGKFQSAIQLNEDPFTGQPIWNEFDPAEQRYEDILGFLLVI